MTLIIIGCIITADDIILNIGLLYYYLNRLNNHIRCAKLVKNSRQREGGRQPSASDMSIFYTQIYECSTESPSELGKWDYY